MTDDRKTVSLLQQRPQLKPGAKFLGHFCQSTVTAQTVHSHKITISASESWTLGSAKLSLQCFVHPMTVKCYSNYRL